MLTEKIISNLEYSVMKAEFEENKKTGNPEPIKKKVDKIDYIYNSFLNMAEDTINKVKRQQIYWESICNTNDRKIVNSTQKDCTGYKEKKIQLKTNKNFE